MIFRGNISVLPNDINNQLKVIKLAAKSVGVADSDVSYFQITRKSIDARKRPKYNLAFEIFTEGDKPELTPSVSYNKLNPKSKKILIIGAGPAGYFAALECLKFGFKPIVIERGKGVRERRKDLKAIQQDGIVNPDSNYCFGEGGAGTYSDGKLYTRSKKRGDIQDVINVLVKHGAHPDIMIDAHPHIGSNKLPQIVANIRETIIENGGEVFFNTRVTDFIIQNSNFCGVVINDKRTIMGQAVILATGHSARDIYSILSHKKVLIEWKPFSVGVRIEHSQELIDQIQYGDSAKSIGLPASSYKLVCQTNKRGVFSFCMCPGGLIVPTATSPGEIVVNGMSLSKRDSLYANAGTVVEIKESDCNPDFGPFSGIEFQKDIEQKLFNFGDGSQKAPAQRLVDFVEQKNSSDLPSCSYIPGIYSAPMHQLLPNFVYSSIANGVRIFGRKMAGYLTNEAIVVGSESRTSSPVRVPRNPDNLMHPQLKGLFPAGEGAGFAGGIMSAAVDGIRVAQKACDFMA